MKYFRNSEILSFDILPGGQRYSPQVVQKHNDANQLRRPYRTVIQRCKSR
jgi:hypothetical protein